MHQETERKRPRRDSTLPRVKLSILRACAQRTDRIHSQLPILNCRLEAGFPPSTLQSAGLPLIDPRNLDWIWLWRLSRPLHYINPVVFNPFSVRNLMPPFPDPADRSFSYRPSIDDRKGEALPLLFSLFFFFFFLGFRNNSAGKRFRASDKYMSSARPFSRRIKVRDYSRPNCNV